MAATLERAPNCKHSAQDVERALHLMALTGNDYRVAEETGIPRRTLHTWRTDTHADRYHAIREQVIPKVHAQIAAECEDLTRGYAALEARGLETLQESWDELKPAEQAAALPKIATVKGINADKARVYRDRPDHITQQRTDPDVLIRALAQAGILTLEAEEITDAQVVEDH